jgi:hypothetical protein
LRPGFFLTFFLTLEFLARLDGNFATRSLASDCPIELNIDKSFGPRPVRWFQIADHRLERGSKPVPNRPPNQKGLLSSARLNGQSRSFVKSGRND